MQTPHNSNSSNSQFGNQGGTQGSGSSGQQSRRFGRNQGGSMNMNQGWGQGSQFGNYGQGFGQGSQFGTYGQGGQFGNYGFGGPTTEDFELTEAWIIPGTGQQQQGQMGQQTGMQRQGQSQGQGQQQMPRGPHTGKGPKRSDQNIDDEVRRHLTQHGHLDASKVDVNVKNGVVTLTGTVDTRQDKRTAEQVADSVPGVKDVENQLKIQQNQQSQQGMQTQQTQQTQQSSSTH